MKNVEAVLFDFGGVFTASPFGAVEALGREIGAAPGQLQRIVFGPYHEDTDHPWHRLERGEMPLLDARDAIMALGRSAPWNASVASHRSARSFSTTPRATSTPPSDSASAASWSRKMLARPWPCSTRYSVRRIADYLGYECSGTDGIRLYATTKLGTPVDLIQAMHTTFACREFLDRDVDDATVYRLLDAARFAPSGGNRQGWRVVVARDSALRSRFAALARPIMQRYVAETLAGEAPYNSILPSKVDEDSVARTPIPDAVVASITTAPVLLMIGVDLRVVTSFDRDLDRVGVVSGASIYPFAWNVLLAARNEGLAGVLTTFLAPSEPEVQQLLGWPESIAVAAAIPIGHPMKQLTRLKRNPVEDFARIGRWDGPPLVG